MSKRLQPLLHGEVYRWDGHTKTCIVYTLIPEVATAAFAPQTFVAHLG